MIMEKIIHAKYGKRGGEYYYFRFILGPDCKMIDYMSELRVKHKYNSILRHLKLLCTNYLKRVPLYKIEKWLYCIKQMDLSKTLYLEKYKELLHDFELEKACILSSEKWKRLAEIAISYGMFRLGYIFRNKMKDVIYNNKKNSRYWVRFFLIAMEDRKYEDAKYVLDRMNASSLFRKYFSDDLKTYNNYYTVLTNNKDKEIRTGIDKKFYNLISNRQVSIIGPAPSKDENIQELNKNSIVIRFNYRGKDKLEENQKCILTNISVYNGGCSNWINQNENNDFLSELDLIVCKHDTKKCFPKNLQSNIHIETDIDSLFLIGIPNVLPSTLFDLCMDGKQKIKVYCNNLYLSNKVWSKNYSIHSKSKIENMFWWPIFAKHELVSQFTFIQNMYCANLFQADEELKNVLELKTVDYVEKMEEIWVNNLLPYKININWRNA